MNRNKTALHILFNSTFIVTFLSFSILIYGGSTTSITLLILFSFILLVEDINKRIKKPLQYTLVGLILIVGSLSYLPIIIQKIACFGILLFLTRKLLFKKSYPIKEKFSLFIKRPFSFSLCPSIEIL